MFLRIFEANNKTYNIMESSNIDYEIAFDSFKNKIKEMAVGSIKRTGIKKIAKPVLILTIIKGIEDGIFKQNYFEYEILEKIYKSIFDKYANIAKQSEYTQLYYPFYHLQSSGFWHLNYISPNSKRNPLTTSAAWVRNNVEYAYINPILWEILQHKEFRNRLAEFIVEERIKTATANCRSMLHMFLNWLVAI